MVSYMETNTCLLHMTDDVQIHGQLDSYSAFPFENFMQSLKKQIRKADDPLSQIVRRISEQEKVKCNTSGRYDEKTFKLLFPHKSGPIPIEKDFDLQYKQMEYKGYILNTKVGDNCCKLVQGEIILIHNFGKKDGVCYVIGKEFCCIQDYFSKPCPSSSVDIYYVNSLGPTSFWPVTDIEQKLVKFNLDEGAVVLPLLH